MKWHIDETTTYFDTYEVEADTREQAIAKHRRGESKIVPGSMTTASEIVDVRDPR